MSSPNKHTKRTVKLQLNNKSLQKMSNGKHQYNNMDMKGLQAFQIAGRKEFLQRIKKEVLVPIQMQNSMLLSKSAPRCMQHTNLITLYCLNEHQPLCVTCMYQNNHHKNHKVIPLNRADIQIEEQLIHYLHSVNTCIQHSDDLINKTHAKLLHSEEQFPQIIKKTSEFYNQFLSVINQKKQQHLRFIEDVWKRLRHEYRTWSQDFQRVRIFLLEKLEQINFKKGNQFLLFNRNLAQNLSNIEPILRKDHCPSHNINFLQQIKKFKEVSLVINSKLILISPFLQNPKKLSQPKFKEQSPSISKINRKSHAKMVIKQKDSFVVATQRNNIDQQQKQNKRRSTSRQPLMKTPINFKEKSQIIDTTERKSLSALTKDRQRSGIKVKTKSITKDNPSG